MRVVVNADDFGWDENRTKAICTVFARNLLSTTTAMANMPWFEKAMGLAKEQGFLDRVGLHFCITEGRALSEEMKNCRVFCDEDGVFTKSFHCQLKTRLMLPRAAKSAVAAEAKAQIERFLSCGGSYLHLDSHHHSHTDLSIATTLLPIAKSYGFTSCRMSKTISKGSISLGKRLYKRMYNSYASLRLPFQVNDFTDFEDFAKSFPSLPSCRSVEIMVHPLYRNGSGELDLNGELMDYKHPWSIIEDFLQKEMANGHVLLEVPTGRGTGK